MGDGISVQTILSQVGAVSKVQQGQQTRPPGEDEFARQLESQNGPESELLKEVHEARDARVNEHDERRSKRRRRRGAKRRKRRRRGGLGANVDVKV